MQIEKIVEDFYNVPNKLRKHKNQIKMNYIDIFYDRHIRMWTAIKCDKQKEQQDGSINALNLKSIMADASLQWEGLNMYKDVVNNNFTKKLN
jgi:hypothetical protein